MSEHVKNEGELKDCPFCGCKPMVIQKSNHEYKIKCSYCTCQLPSSKDDWFTSWDFTLRCWNERTEK